VKNFCGTATEVSIRTNVVLVMEILDEFIVSFYFFTLSCTFANSSWAEYLQRFYCCIGFISRENIYSLGHSVYSGYIEASITPLFNCCICVRVYACEITLQKGEHQTAYVFDFVVSFHCLTEITKVLL
jgi:hypothetical protein